MALISAFAVIACIYLYLGKVVAFDGSRYDNVAVYWGQDSFGATNSNAANFQKPISFYCQDNAMDMIPVAFVYKFFGSGGEPVLNLANTCNPVNNVTFAGTSLAICTSLAADIEYCQSQGKAVTISLGGAGGQVGFTSDSQAQSFALQIWNLFLGGSSPIRPFGSAVLDGVDLDIENGGSTGYVAFVEELRSLAAGASKPYYITAAPQCVFPDANLGSVINQVGFDAIFVQFYDNQCGLNNYNTISDWNFGVWDMWAQQTSPNPNVKIYLGAPASSTAAGSGYVSAEDLSAIATTMRNSYKSFGGVMLWDASQAYANNRYDLAIKQALTAAGPTGFTYPACSAPAYVSGQAYTSGTEVTYQGYIYKAEWWTNAVPSSLNGWMPVSACAGAPTQPTSSSGAASPTSTGHPNCSGVAAWQSTAIYTAGNQVTYGGSLWTAKWWTEGNTPGDSSGVWTNDGAC